MEHYNCTIVRITATLDIVLSPAKGREDARAAVEAALARVVDPNRVTPGILGASVERVQTLDAVMTLG